MKMMKSLVLFRLGSMLMTIVVRGDSQKKDNFVMSFNAYWKYNSCFFKIKRYRAIDKSVCGTLSCRIVKTIAGSWTSMNTVFPDLSPDIY